MNTLTVMPLGGHLGTSGNCDDGVRHRLVVRVDTAVADEVVGCDVRNRLIFSSCQQVSEGGLGNN